ncbi:MAG: amidohydrolase family protein, partial [Vitreoscilla sp.]|nr:amidohydrolase family protein [Polaromonas sp.]
MNDLLIKGALVYDGTGAEPAIKDVSVSAGKITEIGEVGLNLPENARRIIDGTGLALMPGIIDSHTHFDAQITWDATLKPSPALGVTTAVIGNCGFTIAPCKPADRDMTMRNLTQVEGMSLEVLKNGIDWGFETFAEYLAMLRGKGCVVNTAAYIGHSSVRTWVMGADASKREATPLEIEHMQTIVRDAMAAGAVGFASSTSPAHNGEGGLPMPSRLASNDEMMALITAMGERGTGVYMVTKGGQMPVPFLEEMAKQSGRPVMIAALLHNSTNPEAVFKDLDNITSANTRGHRLIGQVSCCPLTMDFTLASPYPVEGLQSWKPALGLQGDALKVVLADKTFRQSVRDEIAAPTTFRLFNGEWDKVHVVETSLPAHNALEQRTVADIAKEQALDPLDVMLDLALA